MSNLKLLRTRIKSVQATQKITKAMQIVSATKFTKIKESFNVSESSILFVKKHLENLNLDYVNSLEDNVKKVFLNTSDVNYCFILITTERGLCGSLNNTLVQEVKLKIRKLKELQKNVQLIIVGKIGIDLFKDYQGIYAQYDASCLNNYDLSLIIQRKIKDLLNSSKIDACYVCFNRSKNAIVQIPNIQKILPISLLSLKMEEFKSLIYQYEGYSLTKYMIDFYIQSQIYSGLLENKISEEAARMVAMDNATNNANDMIEKLILKLNKSRQNLITNDLNEIIAGAEGLE